MKSNKSIKDILKEHKQKYENKGINWEKKKEEWVKSLYELYDQIEKWLKESIDEGIVTTSREKEKKIIEQYIGSYEVKILILDLGSEIIEFVPKGTLLLGAKGRVDMVGVNGEIQLIIPVNHDENGKVIEEEAKWHIAVRRPKLDIIPLDEDTFRDCLEQVMS